MTSYARPEVLTGRTEKISASCGSVFVILNDDKDQIKEVGIIKGKSGCCDNLLLRVVSLLLSKLLQSGLPPEEIKAMLEKQFEGNCGTNPIWVEGLPYHSCIDFIFKRILESMASHGQIRIEE